MKVSKTSTVTKLVSTIDNVNAKINFDFIFKGNLNGSFCFVAAYSYLIDENDPSTSILLKSKELTYDYNELTSLEGSLGAFTGANFVDKFDDMIAKIANNDINDSGYYGLTSVDYIEN